MSCAECGRPNPRPATGRPRLYCSAACRQRAYRGRAAERPPDGLRVDLVDLALRLRANADQLALLAWGWTPPPGAAELAVDRLLDDTVRIATRLSALLGERGPRRNA
ncbi:hypothetical protein [Actinokineospora pegani]|uniref:hypothetical protein n=1 Tax=Actinokineospora pegani TaxID=2654637 RepID=UPI0018D27FBF|nr:hypothetical protein [Actinokineospora pegani]